MREIKYKAWDNDNKVIITPSLYDIGIYQENRTINSIFTDDRLKFMEYTGLKDKNWVEIYEGYIVKWGNAVWVVEWITPIAWFNIQNETHEYSEILWNIYENPNLLKP